MENTEMKPWEPYFPEYVYLYEVGRDADIADKMNIAQECIEKNSLYPISEEMIEWWDFPESYYMEEMRRKMEADGIEWDSDWNTEIMERLRDTDQSTPMKDLFRNSSDIHCYFDLGLELPDPFSLDSEERDGYVKEMCEALGVEYKPGPSTEKLEVVFRNASYGGHLRIYFPMPLKNLLSGEGWDEDRNDFKSIRFKGKFRIAVIDTVGGSGDFEDDMPLDVTFKFDRALLGTEYADHYGFESIFGDNCGIRNCESPELLMDTDENASAIDSKGIKVEREQQRKYQETFDKGGCTFGDTDMNRHRDIEYSNIFPCGWHCPHCGQFWVD